MNSTIPSYILDKRADELLKQRDFDFPGKLNPNERDEERKQNKKIEEYNKQKEKEEKQNEIWRGLIQVINTMVRKTIEEENTRKMEEYNKLLIQERKKLFIIIQAIKTKKVIEEKQNEIYNYINSILNTWTEKTVNEKKQQEQEDQKARKNEQNRKHELLAAIKSGINTRVTQKLNGINYSDFEDDYIVWLWNNIVKSKNKHKESQKDKELKRKMSELIENEMKNRNLPTQGDDFEKKQMNIDPERRKLFIKWAGGYI